MSRIYFHSPSSEAELRGSERAWMDSIVTHIAEGLLNIEGGDDVERLLRLVRDGHYLRRGDRNNDWLASWVRSFHLAWSGPFPERTFAWRGQPLNARAITLNTALKVGNDPVKLAARMCAQCEIHAWVDGPNRAWLADVIDEGLESGLFRRTLQYSNLGGDAVERSQGWEDVAALLRLRDDEPVVTSSSFGDQFPYCAGDHEAWNGLSAQEQWEQGMAALKADIVSGLELRPDGWKDFDFRHGLTVFDLNASDMERRLNEAFAG